MVRRSGVPVSTLHFYEAKGLIQRHRTEETQRRYVPDILRRVAFVREAQRVGISLTDIAAALEKFPTGNSPDREAWLRLSMAWCGELDERIAQLKKLRDALDDYIGCGCLSIDRCRSIAFMLIRPGIDVEPEISTAAKLPLATDSCWPRADLRR